MPPWFIKFALISALAMVVGGLAGFSAVVTSNLPEVSRLENYEPKGVTVLKDIRGQTIHEFFTEKRLPLRLDQIPRNVRLAFLASEDWRFYDHFGIDLYGLFRAVVRNVISGRFAEGASTITQQLARVLFLTSEKTLARKFKEALLAFQIERRYSKDEILALYLNQIYLGSGAYGVQSAAQTYFGKNIDQLKEAEIALLAGLPQAPTRYSPFVDAEAAKKRRNLILQLMNERNVISRGEMAVGMESSVPTAPPEQSRFQSYFAAHVLGLLSENLGEDAVYSGNLTVETTLDLELQRAAERAVQTGLQSYATRHKLISSPPAEKLPQAALIAIDIRTGEIRAMVGGRNFSESQFNRSTQALRQPGSSIKPILYAAAIERGYTQSSLFEDNKIEFDNPASGKWEPKNYDGEYWGFIPLRVALEHSKNVVAVRLLQSIGPSALIQMAQRLGIFSPIAPNLTSALGSSSLKLSELVRAFATFANGGIRPNLRAIRAVIPRSGGNLWPSYAPSQPVLDAKTAYVLTDMLAGVIQAGTGVFAKDLSCAVAGKTGTTDENVDSLFVGYNSHLAAIAWVGFDDRKTLGKLETGAVAAGPIWKEFMETACDGAADLFPPPPGILLVDVDHSSGKLAGRYCGDITIEAFVEGTEPKETCTEEELLVHEQ